ncbi:hypothetical protein M406DRAFT_354503, partial [Cryphonectria parasitica EP155]
SSPAASTHAGIIACRRSPWPSATSADAWNGSTPSSSRSSARRPAIGPTGCRWEAGRVPRRDPGGQGAQEDDDQGQEPGGCCGKSLGLV